MATIEAVDPAAVAKAADGKQVIDPAGDSGLHQLLLKPCGSWTLVASRRPSCVPQHALHEGLYRRAVRVAMLHTSVPILSATDLMVFKLRYGRRKDWADIEELVRSGTPDLTEVRRWLTDIVGADDPRQTTLTELLEELDA